MSNGKRPKENP
jgi:hypothetical protein